MAPLVRSVRPPQPCSRVEGVRVIVLARPSDRLNALVERLGGSDNRVSSVPIDLSSMSSVRHASRTINRGGGHIDALLNIAAVFVRGYQKTSDGFELMLATNYFGPFLLTNLLRDRLLGGGRVINVTAPSTTRVDMERLFSKENFNALHSFGATKALNLMFTFELARRAKRWDVRANAFQPEQVRSELMREAARPIRSPFTARLRFSTSRSAGPGRTRNLHLPCRDYRLVLQRRATDRPA